MVWIVERTGGEGFCHAATTQAGADGILVGSLA